MRDPIPLPLPRKARNSWNYVGWSLVAILLVCQNMVAIIFLRRQGPSSLREILGVALVSSGVGVCLWALSRCPRRPIIPKSLCLLLFLFSFYTAADWILNWAIL